MGLAIYKRLQRLQGGTEAVPSELPSPPYEPEGWYGKALRSVAEQARQGVLPDEALAEIKRDPTSMRAMLAYGEAALTAGTLLSGGGGGKLPKGEMPVRFKAPDVVSVNANDPRLRTTMGEGGFAAGKRLDTGELIASQDLPQGLREYVDIHEQGHHLFTEVTGKDNAYYTSQMQHNPDLWHELQKTGAIDKHWQERSEGPRGVNWREAIPDLYSETLIDDGFRGNANYGQIYDWLKLQRSTSAYGQGTENVVRGYGPRHIENQ